MKKLRAYAPASIGNFAAGFDLMGAAVAPLDGSLWGDVVEAEVTTVPSLTVSGSHAAHLPVPQWENLVLRTYALFREALREKGLDCPGVAFHLEKGLPRSSGLGSSAASVAATLAACQGLLGNPLNRNELYTVAGKAEALVSGAVHLDNVVPAIDGGVQLLVPGPGGTTEARPLPWFDDLVLVVVTPVFELPTERSRKALPKCFSLPETVGFAQNLAAFVHALESGDRNLLRRCLRDPLAEPHRAPLVPGFRAAQAAALADGALGCTLSGSGPSMFAVTQSPVHGREVSEILQSALADAGLTSEARLCRIDHEGARVL
ncbi:MAG TPA: homoserine kinase [Thermoanaerobaculia bacterium]|jgi:homoserine kinase|nr:homoserine kinase [Thermoanaerobaculia bacterium]